MPPAPPGILELAFRLRNLRTKHWADPKLTQATLAEAFSGHARLGSTTIASWENGRQPKLPPPSRLADYAQFFATRRSVEPKKPALVPLDSFTEEEREEYESLHAELLALHAAASGTGQAAETAPAPRSWLFPGFDPVALVCSEIPDKQRPSMANPENPNYTKLLSYGDLDALAELFGHIRAENPMSQVTFKSAPNVLPDDLTSHLVIIGGIGWNPLTEDVLNLAKLPVEQVDDPDYKSGDPFFLKTPGAEPLPRPVWSAAEQPKLREDIGLLARMPNPMNTNRTLTFCNGVHSRGVYGAVRSLTDAQLRESNERYIAENLPGGTFGIVVRVTIMVTGDAMTPDFNNPRTILHQWTGKDLT